MLTRRSMLARDFQDACSAGDVEFAFSRAAALTRTALNAVALLLVQTGNILVCRTGRSQIIYSWACKTS